MFYQKNMEKRNKKTMKQRTCDKCKKVIESKQDYIKCCQYHWVDNYHSELNHVGDLCLECMDLIIGIKETK